MAIMANMADIGYLEYNSNLYIVLKNKKSTIYSVKKLNDLRVPFFHVDDLTCIIYLGVNT